jgi:acyl-homoserine-lactone acylase
MLVTALLAFCWMGYEQRCCPCQQLAPSQGQSVAPEKEQGSARTSEILPSHSRAEILWDSWGVPHIFAQDVESAFRALGWAQAQSHGNLLLKLYGIARGRGAEYFGRDLLTADRAVRIMGTYETAKRWYRQQRPEFRKCLDAFAAGINQFADTNRDKIDSSARCVLPVDGIDTIAHPTRILFMFLNSVSHCARVLPNGFTGDLPAGSNAWVIAPSRTTNGHALMLVNPHLPWSGEGTLFEAQVVAPGFNFYGMGWLGWPVLILGFNDSCGWAATVNTILPGNLYELTLENDGYCFDGQTCPFTAEIQTLKIRQTDGQVANEPLAIRHSIHGPVVEASGKTFALRIAGLSMSSFSGMLQQLWDMAAAKDWSAFQSIIQRLQLPMFTILYAGRDGHIAGVFNGQVPLRSFGDAAYWSRPVPGDISRTLWNAVHAHRDLPKIIDPAGGWVENSNSVPWYMAEPSLDPARYSPSMAPRHGLLDDLLREQRGQWLLKHHAPMSLEQLVTDKHSTRSELAERILEDLLLAVDRYGDQSARKAAAVLRAWDRETNADSRGAILFQAWAKEVEWTRGIFSFDFDPQHPFDTPRGLKDPLAATKALSAAAARLERSYGRLDTPWGAVYRFRRGRLDLPANGGPNLLSIFRTIEFGPANDGRFTATGGDSFVAAVEFSDPPRAKVVLSYGNSSNPLSPHYGDQLSLLAEKQMRDAWRSPVEIKHHLEGVTLMLADGNFVPGH